MKFNQFTSYLVIVVLLPLLSCEKTIIEQVSGPNGNGKLYSIEGHAQKGPFIVGTDVTVAELNDKLFPTGRVFFSTILDDKGYFELPGVVLESPYVQIKIRGKYFSEVWWSLSEETTLYSLADITKKGTINVNIITHLEKERVEYLVQKEGKSFEEAKAIAFNEFLKIFNWDDLDVGESESLDISEDNLGGALLLATASIFEHVQDEYVDRLATITDFKVDFKDGTIDSKYIQSGLLISAAFIDRNMDNLNNAVKDNIINAFKLKYEDAPVPDFQSLVSEFVTKSEFIDYLELDTEEVFPLSDGAVINLLQVPNGNTLDATKKYAVIINPPSYQSKSKITVHIHTQEPNDLGLEGQPYIQDYILEFKDEKTWKPILIPLVYNQHGQNYLTNAYVDVTIDMGGFSGVYYKSVGFFGE